ncbi:hypothetical protein MNBD_GAMMA25-366 [hydrothermal vent metagenome]|uniref:histidine kinase n=1 Tax=hydrothermal vent metagenome TaxID=652676 RepID=A0A3B1BS41_9ZZZZ
MMGKATNIPDELQQRLRAEQLHTHYQQLPAMIIAPALGALFTAWVLWDAVNTSYLKTGLAMILSISLLRIFLYRKYFSRLRQNEPQQVWRVLAISLALLSGCIWGSTAIFLYPPLQAEYEVYMLVLLALVPVAPMAALAVYMPAFYVYYLPCIAPFVITLGLQEGRAEKMTALLLLMMSGAIITFANKYAAMLTEAIRLRLQLAEQTEKLEQAAIVKTRFLAAASHDLRQPVHAMGLFIASLQTQCQELGQNKLFTQIAQSILVLRRMLDTMLDISRLDAGIIEVHQQDFKLSELMNRLRDEFAPLAAAQGLEFRYVKSRQIVNTDPALLERILRNLLTNALKYTHHGRILFGCRRCGENIKIQIGDTGSGIPPTQLENIFIEFTRLENNASQAEQGMGLGLSISQRLTDLLQHSLTVYSQEGRGSIFSLSLPCHQRSVKLISINQINHPVTRPNLHQWQVIIVDDDDAVRLGMTALLTQWHARVIAAANIDELSKKLQKTTQAPDLLITDYRLAQGVTAEDIIRIVNDKFKQAISTIIITGDTTPARILEAHNAGQILLHKPVDPEKLKACINSLKLESAGQAAAL